MVTRCGKSVGCVLDITVRFVHGLVGGTAVYHGPHRGTAARRRGEAIDVALLETIGQHDRAAGYAIARLRQYLEARDCPHRATKSFPLKLTETIPNR